MTVFLSCCLIPWTVMVSVYVAFPRRVLRGLLTRSLCRNVPRLRDPYCCRNAQMLAALVVGVALSPFVGDTVGSWIFCALMVAPFVDDVATGGDDPWKRWRRAAGNLRRWRRWAPLRRPLVAAA